MSNFNASSQLADKLLGANQASAPDPNTGDNAEFFSGLDSVAAAERKLSEIKSSMPSSEVYGQFIKETQDFNFNEASTEAYWALREDAFDGPPELFQAHEEASVVNKINGAQTDQDRMFMLTDAMDSAPMWMQERFEPQLASYREVDASQNKTKASAAYRLEAGARAADLMMANALDPQVSINTHTTDYVRLEAIGLAGSASVQAGRVGVDTPNGFFLASQVSKPSDVGMPDDLVPGEGASRAGSAYPVVQSRVRESLKVNRYKAKSDVEASNGLLLKQMREGNVDRSSWMDVVSVMNAPEGSEENVVADLYSSGVAGSVLSNKYGSADEAISAEMTSILRELGRLYGNDAQ